MQAFYLILSFINFFLFIFCLTNTTFQALTYYKFLTGIFGVLAIYGAIMMYSSIAENRRKKKKPTSAEVQENYSIELTELNMSPSKRKIRQMRRMTIQEEFKRLGSGKDV